mgnify:CR=1 FL=1
MANKTLNAAKAAKNDEFYTQLSDIENELRHYKEHFRGKTVLCNCDDPRVSNFFKYFTLNFEHLGLKRLITTCYKNQNVDLFSQHDCEQAVYLIYDGDKNGNHVPDAEEIGVHPLKGDGDFRSRECIELLKEADIVVTNPPFSLFREYVAQLMKYEKKFLIIGNINALHYKEIFPLIKENKIWLGVTNFNTGMYFFVPESFEYAPTYKFDREKNGKKVNRVPGVCWFTNLDHNKRHEEMILYRRYTPEDYPKYYNYDGIDISNVAEIPMDYYEDMGVPDTFIDKYNPDQFELIGFGTEVPKTKEHISYKEKDLITYEVNGRIVWSTKYSVSERKAGNSLRLDDNGMPGKLPYSRIIIRLKKK